MSEQLPLGHQLLDRLHGDAGELRKLDVPTLKKAALRAGDKKLAAQLDDAIVNHDGSVDIRATALKFARREFYARLPASDPRLAKQWADTGNSDAAPRGSGPMPKPPEAQPRMTEDQGNRAQPAIPVMTSAGAVFEGGVHNPEFAMRLLQACIDNARRAQRQK